MVHYKHNSCLPEEHGDNSNGGYSRTQRKAAAMQYKRSQGMAHHQHLEGLQYNAWTG